jgi:Protein of unknown function (DUF1553)/Protein of unknown function (DUF1549)/Concanavalin A-like lectin/glucanases superfamily/Planctomycete cytochrome C
VIRRCGYLAIMGLLQFVGASLEAGPQQPDNPSVPRVIEFNQDIRPILSDKCFTCHGPDKARRMMNLRFDVEAGAKQDLGGGQFAIVPGDPAKSLMIQRITATDPARRMPPVSSGRTLTEHEIALIRAWIEQGAKWEKYWAFVPPKRPELPKVNDTQWPRSAIDYFVLQRLEQEGLKPSPEADRATLIRRVTLDLTGLPPSPAEMDAFVSDKSPDAYEKVVDRLLQSPRYGERMASPWLDAARYADSNGYLGDRERRMWRWRDWVIDAFNRNMPFDQFTIDQLAGDLLPNATLDQKIATGFNRNHRITNEGGIIPEEYLVEYSVDRVDTTATTFLGLTLGCARCHDHKYDPFSQKEYYQLFSYFDNIPESGMGVRVGNSPPFIKAPTAEQQAQLKKLNEELKAAQEWLAKLQPESAEREWEKTVTASKLPDWAPSRGLIGRYALDGDLANQVSQGKDGKTAATVQAGEAAFVPGRIGQAMDFDGKRFIETAKGDQFDQLGDLGYFAKDPLANEKLDDAFTLAVWIYPTSGTGAIVTQAQDNPNPNGTGLYLKDGKVQFYKVVNWVENDGVRVESEAPLELNQWHHLMVSYAGTRVAAGVHIYVDGVEQKFRTLLDELNGDKAGILPFRIGAGGGAGNRFHGRIDEVRVYGRVLSAEEAAILADPRPISEIGAMALDQRSPADKEKILAYFVENAASAEIREAGQRIIQDQARLEEFYEDIPTVMVMEEMAKPREAHVLLRGAYDQPGEKVSPGIPEILPPMPAGYPNNRLGLARWLVDGSNPLTARVVVNRFWQMLFGTGLVKTVENFGSQGEPPSHPELLDWLSTEFVRTGWDMKGILRTMVTSATYRQSSKISPELLEKDPENRLLARGPRFRLPAEMIRDQALAFAGLLVNKIGGPPVKPYQPAGLWLEVSKGEEYKQDYGDELYRRSLYTFRRRAVPQPMLANFDAPSRESCVVRQTLTNTPLQALDLMNDVTFVEAARVFAARVMREGGKTPEERIAFAFRLATARSPRPEESRVLLALYKQELVAYQKDPDTARKALNHGEHPVDQRLEQVELAAYTSITRLILNLDETITKE